jgi:hypothetical protein
MAAVVSLSIFALLIGSVLKHKLVCLRLGKDLAPDRFSNLAAGEATHSC